MRAQDITLWVDERWGRALESSTGKSVEALMQEKLDELIRQLPQETQDRIDEELRQEDLESAREAEASRRFSVLRVTQGGQTEALLQESGDDFFSLASRLRSYLRQPQDKHFSAALPGPAPLSEEAFGGYVLERLRGTGRVVGVFDLDLDAGRVSSMDGDDRWRSYLVRDVSTAVWKASRKSCASHQAMEKQFGQLLEGRELRHAPPAVQVRGQEPFPAEGIRFWHEVEQLGPRLNFYIPIEFDPDAVFGTDVATSENDDWINVYANYDMESGCVCNQLKIDLVRANGTELDFAYQLSEDEMSALLPKMDAYCQQVLWVPLRELRRQYFAEEAAGDQSKTLRELLEGGLLKAGAEVTISHAAGSDVVVSAEDLLALTPSGREQFSDLLRAKVKTVLSTQEGIELAVDGVEVQELAVFAQARCEHEEAEQRMTM